MAEHDEMRVGGRHLQVIHHVDASLGHLIDLAGGQIDGGDAMRIGAHELLAVGRVGVLVEIERGGAGFARKPNHAVARVGIDPFR